MAKKNLPEWATKVRQLRIKLELTQTEFGKHFGVTQEAVSYWEQGIYEPPAKVFMKIIEALQR